MTLWLWAGGDRERNGGYDKRFLKLRVLLGAARERKRERERGRER